MDRRSAVRIDDYIAFEYEILPEYQYKMELESFPKTSSGVEQIELKYPFFSWIQDKYKEIEGSITIADQVILDLLVSINDKLDFLIRALASDKKLDETNLCFKKPSYVNISGGGIRFLADSEIKKGSFLRIRICVPLFPPFVITTLGKVIWTQKEEYKYKVGVQFTAIHEDDKEALIHYIFIRQRKLIKKSKESHS